VTVSENKQLEVERDCGSAASARPPSTGSIPIRPEFGHRVVENYEQ
jgi:hypothetical protein